MAHLAGRKDDQAALQERRIINESHCGARTRNARTKVFASFNRTTSNILSQVITILSHNYLAFCVPYGVGSVGANTAWRFEVLGAINIILQILQGFRRQSPALAIDGPGSFGQEFENEQHLRLDSDGLPEPRPKIS